MKSSLLSFLLILSAITAFSQLDSMGTHVNFTIDGDTKTGHSKLGPPIATVYNNDDWFSISPYPGIGRSIIDTSNSAYYLGKLQSGENISFVKRMSVPVYAVIYPPMPPKFWVDALYSRDNAYNTDSSIFSTGAKNGGNPNLWPGGIGNVPVKTDIVDAYAHTRTSGTNPVTDSVWFMAGVSTVGTNGSRYFDIEVYREDFSYNKTTNTFVTPGIANGHSAWTFDAAGNVTRTGDIIISVTYNPGSAPLIDYRIWVSDSTYANVLPTKFIFNSNYDGSGGYGYAQIESPGGGTRWGSGRGNYSNNTTSDTTYSTPWGTVNSSGAWSQNYEQLQFVEIALNFSRFGMNPFAYVTSFCTSPYSSIIIKSRSSASFSANLQDFVMPQPFTVKNLSPFESVPDTLSCTNTAATIKLSAAARNYYRWSTLSGTPIRPDSDSLNFTVFTPGTYVVEATNFMGCPALGRDTIVIPADYHKPVASIFAYAPQPDSLQFLGGNTTASNYSTPFGFSNGLLWDWSGPDGFTSTIQNPKTDTTFGEYQLIVTEIRNGCKDTALATISFAILEIEKIVLRGQLNQGGIQLSWNNPDPAINWKFIIEKSTDGIHFIQLSAITDKYDNNFHFTDVVGSKGNNYYRIKCEAANYKTQYSNNINVYLKEKGKQILVSKIAGARMVNLSFLEKSTGNLVIKVLDLTGRTIQNNQLYLSAAATNATIILPETHAGLPVVIAIYSDKDLLLTKLIL